MLIGICGKMGSGKDTVANFLVGKFNTKKIAFADKLKEVAKDLFNVQNKSVRGREILQQLGEKMREIHENVWIDIVLNGYEEDLIISDVRYANEAKAIMNAGGMIIHLDVADFVRKYRVEKRAGVRIDKSTWVQMNAHSSETGVDLVAKIKGVKHVYITPLDDKEIVNFKVMKCIPKRELGEFFE